MIPAIDSLSKQSYVKFLLLESLDVLHMMVDDPYRSYSTWMAVRQLAKGEYSALISMIEEGQADITYVKHYVNEVYKVRGLEHAATRKCSDTNNTYYFITSFILRFLKERSRRLVPLSVKQEDSSEQKQLLYDMNWGIKELSARKSQFSLMHLIENQRLKEYINREYMQSKQFLLEVLSYEKITSLTVKNIVDKY